MGLESEFFIASASELKQVQLKNWPFVPKTFEQFSCKGLTNVELATLEALLTSKDALTIIEGDDTKPVMEGGIDGPWLLPLRPQLTKALSEAELETLPELAEQWAGTEELEGWDASDTEGVLNELYALAQSAVACGKKVYLLMWM